MGMLRVVGLFLLLAGAAQAGGLETLVAPPHAARGGERVEFAVYLHNTGDRPLPAALPARLSCRLESAGRVAEVVASALPPLRDEAAPLGEGGFVKGRYALPLPPGWEGTVRMAIRELLAADVIFEVRAAPPAGAAAPPRAEEKPEKEEPEKEYVTLQSLFTLYQPYLVNISGYDPMYFLVGTDPEKSKFQLSFKYRLLNPAGGLAAKYPWLEGLHIGYTQTSFWNLKAESAPFDDTSYKPELFFVSPNLGERPNWLKGLFVQSGLQHESNGRDGAESRSTNYFYLKPIVILYDQQSRLGMQIAPKFWSYLGNDRKTNPDLMDYRGYFELDLKAGRADGLVLGSYWRWGKRGGSVQLDLTYPIRPLLGQNVDLYFHVQYANTLAESLLHFRDRSQALRVGFSIVR